MARAVETGAPVEVAELTDERTKITADPETGRFTAELNAFPVRVKRDGAWRDVDLTLVREADGSVRSKVGYADVTLSGGGGAPLFTLGGGGSDTGLAWDGPLPEPNLDGTKATYTEVLPGLDLVAKVGVEGVSTYLVVKSREAAANPRVKDLKYKVVGSASQARGTASGGEIRDASGAVKFHVQRASMWDSKGAPAGLESHERVSPSQQARLVTVPVEAAADELAVNVDEAFLQAPETVYPAVIDPEVSVSGSPTYWVAVQSNGTRYVNSSTEHARIGYQGWSSPYFTSRAFYNFNTEVLHDKIIGSATFSHKLIHSPNWDCAAATYGPGVSLGVTGIVGSSTIWPGPAWTATIGTNAKAHGDSGLCSGYDVVEWDAKSAVKTYASDVKKPTLTLGLKSSSETNRDGWRKFDNDATAKYPRLVVTYNSRPNKAGLPTIDHAKGSGPSAWLTTTETPTLRATVSDPDGAAGGNIQGWFEITSGTVRIAEGAGSPVLGSGGTSVWTVPAGELSGTLQYTVRVWGLDSLGAKSLTPSDEIQFRVDTRDPAKPAVTEAAEGYVVGGKAPFTVSWTDNDVSQVCWGTAGTSSNCQTVASSSRYTIVETAPTGLTSAGPHTVVVKVVDMAGRSSLDATIQVTPTADGPSGIWHLDSSGVDASGNVDLNAAGAPTYVSGNFAYGDESSTDRAASLNGATQALASSGTVIKTDASFSIAAWVKFDPSRNSDPYQFAVSQTNTTYAGAYLGVQQGRAAFGTRTGDLSSQTHQFALSPASIPAGEWVHLAGVYNAVDKTNKLYINRELVNSIPVTSATAATGPFTIGRSKSSGAATHHWGGEVDEVVVFPRAIGDSTIGTLQYNRPEPKKAA